MVQFGNHSRSERELLPYPPLPPIVPSPLPFRRCKILPVALSRSGPLPPFAIDPGPPQLIHSGLKFFSFFLSLLCLFPLFPWYFPHSSFLKTGCLGPFSSVFGLPLAFFGRAPEKRVSFFPLPPVLFFLYSFRSLACFIGDRISFSIPDMPAQQPHFFSVRQCDFRIFPLNFHLVVLFLSFSFEPYLFSAHPMFFFWWSFLTAANFSSPPLSPVISANRSRHSLTFVIPPDFGYQCLERGPTRISPVLNPPFSSFYLTLFFSPPFLSEEGKNRIQGQQTSAR